MKYIFVLNNTYLTKNHILGSCPSGQEDINGTCTLCAKGYYKDNSVNPNAQFGECTKCNVDYTTAGSGSISADNCSIRKTFNIFQYSYFETRDDFHGEQC